MQMAALGHLMWIRTGILAVLLLRGADGIGFSFLPRSGDWRVGVRQYLFFAPVGLDWRRRRSSACSGWSRSPRNFSFAECCNRC
jgi:hypothetical protein